MTCSVSLSNKQKYKYCHYNIAKYCHKNNKTSYLVKINIWYSRRLHCVVGCIEKMKIVRNIFNSDKKLPLGLLIH